MSSPEEMRSQSGKHAADADDDIVVIDRETAVGESGREPWTPGSETSSAPATGTQPGQAGPTAGEGPGGMSSAADEADGASPVAAGEPGGIPSSAADEANGASPMAGEGPGGMSSAADEADGASPTAAEESWTPWSAADRGPRTGPRATPQTAGASPIAGNAASLGGTDPWAAPPSTGNDEGAGPQTTATRGAASMSATASRTGPSAPADDRRWREIQGMFVDDPRDSVQRASDLIDTAIEEFLASIRQRQAALASSWQNREADTEVLRVALKDYRALWAVVRDMPAVDVPGGAAVSAGAGGSSFGAGPGGPAGRPAPERGNTPA